MKGCVMGHTKACVISKICICIFKDGWMDGLRLWFFSTAFQSYQDKIEKMTASGSRSGNC